MNNPYGVQKNFNRLPTVHPGISSQQPQPQQPAYASRFSQPQSGYTRPAVYAGGYSQPVVYRDTSSQPAIQAAGYGQSTVYAGGFSRPAAYKGAISQPAVMAGTASQLAVGAGTASQLAVRAGTASQLTIRAGTASQPVVRAGTASQPPVWAGTARQPPVWAGTASQPGVRAGTASQPGVRAGTASQPGVWAGTTSQPAIRAAISSQPPAVYSAGYAQSTVYAGGYSGPAVHKGSSTQPPIQPGTSSWPAMQADASRQSSTKRESDHEAVVITDGYNQSAVFRDFYKHVNAEHHNESGKKFSETGVFLSRIPYGVTDDILMGVIKKFGKVRLAKLDRYSGTAAVEFEERKSAELLLKSNINILTEKVCVAPLIVAQESSAKKSSKYEEKERTPPEKELPERSAWKSSRHEIEEPVEAVPRVEPRNRNEVVVAILEEVRKSKASNLDDKLIAVVVDHVILKESLLTEKLSSVVKDIKGSLPKKLISCEVSLIGSAAMGVLMKGDPIEVSIQLSGELSHLVNSKKTAVTMINNELSYNEKFGNVFGLVNSCEPMVVCVHKLTQFVCDLTVNDNTDPKACLKISSILRLNLKIRILTMFIMCWARGLKMINKDKFSSYAVVLLVVFYLQQIEDAMVPAVRLITKENINEIGQNISNKDSLRKLTEGFFRFYSEINLRRKVLSPYVGDLLQRTLFLNVPEIPYELQKYKEMVENGSNMLRIDTPIVVQDPYNVCKNVTERVSDKTVENFQFSCRQALEMVVSRHLPRLLTEHCMPSEDRNSADDMSSEQHDEAAMKSSRRRELEAELALIEHDMNAKGSSQEVAQATRISVGEDLQAMASSRIQSVEAKLAARRQAEEAELIAHELAEKAEWVTRAQDELAKRVVQRKAEKAELTARQEAERAKVKLAARQEAEKAKAKLAARQEAEKTKAKLAARQEAEKIKLAFRLRKADEARHAVRQRITEEAKRNKLLKVEQAKHAAQRQAEEAKIVAQRQAEEALMHSWQHKVETKASSRRHDVEAEIYSPRHDARPVSKRYLHPGNNDHYYEEEREMKAKSPSPLNPSELAQREMNTSFKATKFLQPKYLVPETDSGIVLTRKDLFQRWLNVMLVILPDFLINFVRLDVVPVYDAGPDISWEPKAKARKLSFNNVQNSGKADEYKNMVMRKKWVCEGHPVVCSWQQRKKAAAEIDVGPTTHPMEREALVSKHLAESFSTKEAVSFHFTIYVQEEQERIRCFFENLHRRSEPFVSIVQSLVGLLPLWVGNAFEVGFSLRCVTGVYIPGDMDAEGARSVQN